MEESYTYMMTNATHTVIYIGVTTNLHRRLLEHANGLPSFTKRYEVHKLVYFEQHAHIQDAIACEKRWKGWSRRRKMELIDPFNPTWRSLNDSV